MTQSERRAFLIRALLDERPRDRGKPLPSGKEEQERLLRSLFNLRAPRPADAAFLAVQDAYLRERNAARGVTDANDLAPVANDLYLWQGDITTLRCDAIVNAANSGMTGCYVPCHACIDNCIHTYAGVQLRLECDRLMRAQGHDEEIGGAKITPAYNLPCRYVLHTVGPAVLGQVSEKDETLLASCYRSCLALAAQNEIRSLAFCCISTGVFCFPNDLAAAIAVRTVRAFKTETGSDIKVIFNVFKDEDYRLYQALLGAPR